MLNYLDKVDVHRTPNKASSCLVLLELDIPFWLLQTIQILDKLIHGQKSFSRMHARHLVDLKPSRHSITSIVRSPQSTVLILY